MKREELEKLGLSKDQIDKVLDMHHEEYDPLKKQKDAAESELETVKKKNGAQEETIQKLKTDLEGFKNEDVSGMKKRIADLEKDIQTKDAEYQKEISERDFNDVLKDAITSAKGRNAKAIRALLNLDELKTSKNQKEDIVAALKDLAEAEDSKMLFGESEPNVLGKGDPIGSLTKTGSQDSDAAMRSVMGLPPAEKK